MYYIERIFSDDEVEALAEASTLREARTKARALSLQPHDSNFPVGIASETTGGFTQGYLHGVHYKTYDELIKASEELEL